MFLMSDVPGWNFRFLKIKDNGKIVQFRGVLFGSTILNLASDSNCVVEKIAEKKFSKKIELLYIFLK